VPLTGGAGLALLLAACGGSSGASSGSAASPAAAASSAMPGMSMPGSAGKAGSQTPVATTKVAIENFAFVPATITVKAGSTVTWTNKDQDPHTATSQAKKFSSPTLNRGDVYRFRFTKPGRYPYLCTIHPFMTATVVVTP
jgi:plastocyanin